VVRSGASLNLHDFFNPFGFEIRYSFLLNGAEISQPSTSRVVPDVPKGIRNGKLNTFFERFHLDTAKSI
jgi:hypothetical protein